MTVTRVTSQAGGATGASNANVTHAFSGNVTAGNTIKIEVSRFTPSSSPLTAADVTKSAGTATIGAISCDSAVERNSGGGVFLQAGVFLAQVTGTGSCTMQASKGVTNGVVNIGVDELHSDAGSNVLAFLAGSNKTGNNSTGAPATASTTSTGNSIIGQAVVWDSSANETITPVAGFTTVYNEQNGLANLVTGSSDKISTGETITPGWSAPTTHPWAAASAVYQEPSAGGGLPFFMQNAVLNSMQGLAGGLQA